ncbi:FRG domain-containing protein [Sharpea azabuensis]|uniref:FRG domain-containing protein n=1 Tax=Sharpea azabuensis TaxID=322505 RepID=UPI003C6FEEE9
MHYCIRDNISVSKEEFKIKSLAQHYGVPTRLLDWTLSPFVAAYFAFSSTIPSRYNRIAIWALKKDHDIWNSNIGVKIMEGTYSQENVHMRKQLGCFTFINNSCPTTINNFLDFDLSTSR